MTPFLILKFFHCIILSRRDRNRYGGGVFILAKQSIPSSFFQSSSSIELIWVRIHLKCTQDTVLGCFYCPPMAHISVLEDLQNSLHEVKSAYSTAKIFLGGDFNSPGINWSSGSTTNSYVSASFREKLIEVSKEFHLEQLVLKPTRQHNILDLCFTSHPSTVISSQTSPGLSDHEAVIIKFLVGLVYQRNLLGRFIYIRRPTGMKLDQIYYMFQKYTLN